VTANEDVELCISNRNEVNESCKLQASRNPVAGQAQNGRISQGAQLVFKVGVIFFCPSNPLTISAKPDEQPLAVERKKSNEAKRSKSR